MNREEENEDGRSKEVIKRHSERLKHLRKGQEYLQVKDIPRAAGYFLQYLNILAEYYGVEEDQLSPELFDEKKDLAELLLISHVYWDLAKIYDQDPNLHSNSEQCLSQFDKFTSGYKYQHANASILKNFLKKGLVKNHKAFSKTYDNIRSKSGSCFVASYSFGYNHQVTNELRRFKLSLLRWPFGTSLVNFYYRYSKSFITILESYREIRFVIMPMVKGILRVVAFIHKMIKDK